MDANNNINERLEHAVVADSGVSAFVDINHRKRSGQPCLKGTRYPLSAVFAELSDNRTVKELENDMDLPPNLIAEFLNSLAIFFDRPFVYKSNQGMQNHVDETCHY